MALKQTLRDAVDAVFAGLDDIPLDITYVKVTVGAYDIDNDVPGVTTTNVAIQAILYNGKDIEQDSIWRMTSAQAKHTHTDETYVLLPASTLGSYKPKTTDYLMIEGEKYEIYGKVPVPSDPCYILKVRKP